MDDTPPAGSKVLICEDDPELAQLISLFLEKNGYLFDIASNAEDAKEQLTKTTYDVITVDISLPGQDGISLIIDLKENESTAEIPIVVISISDRSEHYKKLSFKRIETNGWVTKPISEKNLISVIKRAHLSAQKSGAQ